jgi:hypothetical protein
MILSGELLFSAAVAGPITSWFEIVSAAPAGFPGVQQSVPIWHTGQLALLFG